MQEFLSKLIRPFWLAALLVIVGAASSVTGPVMSGFVIPYDGQKHTNIAYDGNDIEKTGYIATQEGKSDYDEESTLAYFQKKIRSLGMGGFVAEFADSLAAETTALKEGSFSIVDWSGYPANLPKPTGPFRLLEGAEYDAARAEANAANRAMHQADPSLNGLQLHEIQPVKFGGSPTDPLNKIPLTPQQHAPATTWWNQLQRNLEGN